MSRSIKKGPFVAQSLYKKITKAVKENNKRPLKTYSRASTVIPSMVGLTITVYNGKTFVPVFITENLVGHKLGEFSPTRMFRGHAKSDKKGKR